VTSKSVLFFSPRPCFPADSGAKLREYHLLRQLSREMHVDLLAFETTGPFQLPFAGQVRTVPRPPRYTLGKLLKGLATGMPVSIWNYYCPQMAAALGEMLAARRYDAVVLESIHMAGYRNQMREQARGALLVYDWHNIESELMERYASQTSSLPRKLYAGYTARLLRRLELEVLNEDTAHVVCSAREEAWLLRQTANQRVRVISNGVDTTIYEQDAVLTTERNRILFVGSMDYHPNVVAVRYFASRVWPALHAVRKDLKFTIVGSNPGPQVRELAAAPGIEVTGTVPRVEPYYNEAAIVVVPLFEGGGTRLKIVEAMAAGVPVVSTRMGAEGIDVHDGETIVFREDGEDWVEAITGLLTDAERWRRIGQAGRKLARERYDWQSIGTQFAVQLNHWLTERQANHAD
jgi:sugar transferase (PEP-CTERM/EpsH1 system associated)